MKRMSSLAYHFGVKLRFYPSSKQKKIIKFAMKKSSDKSPEDFFRYNY